MEQLEERDAEIAAVGRVLDGGGGGLLIEGPPGIGKTRLLGAARALADGRLVLSARGSELERDFPFAVVRQLLEPVVRDEHFGGAAALARPVLRGVGGEQDAGSALHGLYWLVANLAEERPLLVLVDDIHWADLASLRWLAYLAQRLDGLAVGLVAAARPAEAGEGQPVLDDLAHNPSIEVLEPRGLSAARGRPRDRRRAGGAGGGVHRRLRAGHRRQPVPARRAAARARRRSRRRRPTRRWSSARRRARSAAPRSRACAACPRRRPRSPARW